MPEASRSMLWSTSRRRQGTKGNKSEAARLLRTDYKTLHLKMKQYGISRVPFRES
jgi:DNA-binding NtrC family response regulator